MVERRHDFGSLMQEPEVPSLYHTVLGWAAARFCASIYTLPPGTRTVQYAEALAARFGGPQGACSVRVQLRVEAVLAQNRVQRVSYTTGAALIHPHLGGADVMRDQIRHLAWLIKCEQRNGPESTHRIGIVPARLVYSLPGQLNPWATLSDPDRDTTVITTSSQACYLVNGPGGSHIEHLQGEEGQARALSCFAALRQWDAAACFGRAALAELAACEAVL